MGLESFDPAKFAEEEGDTSTEPESDEPEEMKLAAPEEDGPEELDFEKAA
jgi:hypothetical protein